MDYFRKGMKTTRSDKVRWMKDNIEAVVLKHKKKVDCAKLLAEFALAMESTKRTGYEILRDLEISRRVTIKRLSPRDSGEIIACEFGK